MAGFLQSAWADTLSPVLPQFTAYDPPRDFPNLTYQDKDGKPRKLSEHKGRLVLVNLWATWCLPCTRELPALNRLQLAFEKTGFRVLPISFDMQQTVDNIPAFYATAEITALPILKNPNFDQMKALRPAGLPTSYLILPDGRAAGVIEGYAHWDTPEGANLIEAYLPKASTKKKK